jgi:hypothetical protein
MTPKRMLAQCALMLLVGLWCSPLSVSAQSGPTETPTPTVTATLTPVPTPTPYGYDADEPNDMPEQATRIGVGTRPATLHMGDEDWYVVQLKADRPYRIEVAAEEGDPMLALYEGFTVLAVNRDCAPGTLSACLDYRAGRTQDILIHIAPEVAGLFVRYRLRIVEVLPTSTPEPSPTFTPYPTPTPGPTATPNDAFENNSSFETAADLVIGRSIKASLVPGDNDFFRIHLQAGVPVRCDVIPEGNLDTNLIVYDHLPQGIGGNTYREPGDPGSALSWMPSYTGWYYLLIGPLAGSGDYSLACIAAPPTPTPTPTALPAPNLPPATPQPTPTRFVLPTPTSSADAASQPEHTSTPPLPPTPTVPPIRLVLYYDADNDGSSSPSEGIEGMGVVLLDGSTNQVVQHARTDPYGAVLFTDATASQYLRISLPYLGFSKRVAPGAVEDVRVAALRIPSLIP